MFIKYPHLERLGNDAVDNIEIGTCHIFPKIDGTNASVWVENGELKCGSRTRQLTEENDNAGFCKFINTSSEVTFKAFFKHKPTWRLYGEWLVPHTIKNYREDTWREFYVFDVLDGERFVPYEEYKDIIKSYAISVIPCLATITNPTPDILLKYTKENTYLMSDGQGHGEGIVLKRYGYQNKFGVTTWAKLVTNEFKEAHVSIMSGPKIYNEIIEDEIVKEFLTQAVVDKAIAKITLQHGGWSSKCIPQLLGTVWYDFIHEELWGALKKFKNPRIYFGTLHTCCITRIKELAKDKF